MPQMARRPFIKNTLGQPAERVKGMAHIASEKPAWATKDHRPKVNHYLHFATIVDCGDSLSAFSGAAMRSISALVACTSLLFGPAAWADSRVFIIANQPDGYGVDQCLAKGEKCGAHAAQSYCQSRSFTQASAFRRVDPDEITGSVPKGSDCGRSGCGDYVAITCQR
jgi:hypothetical protein